VPTTPTFHVHGTATISVGLDSNAGLHLLGHSLNGVDLNFDEIAFPIYTDAGGGDGGVPVAYQKIAETCRISADVVVSSEDALALVRKGPELGTEGTMIAAGAVLAALAAGVTPTGFYPLAISGIGGDSIASGGAGTTWTFRSVRRAGKAVRLGTRVNIWRLAWLAIPAIGDASSYAASANTGVLYSRA
jgi:hypothetical protein